MFPTTAPDSLVLYKKVLSSKSLHIAISKVKVFVLIEGDIDLISPSQKSGGSKTQVTGQVRSGHSSGHRSGQVAGQVTGQVNRKNIFLVRKLTIFNSMLTRYEKESVIMRGIVYFKLQDVALRD